jgi:hypothetical protein
MGMMFENPEVNIYYQISGYTQNLRSLGADRQDISSPARDLPRQSQATFSEALNKPPLRLRTQMPTANANIARVTRLTVLNGPSTGW